MNNNTVIITYSDHADPVDWDDEFKDQFESLISTYDPNVKFQYLKSFRRIRIDFSNDEAAESALVNLNKFHLCGIQFKCLPLNPIKFDCSRGLPSVVAYDPRFDESQIIFTKSNDNRFLNVPKPKRMFLISPPPSPPEGWAPIEESPPVIDVQLISAISNMLPGQIHEIHPATESQPGIFVEVCEDLDQNETSFNEELDDEINIQTDTNSH